MMVADTSAIIAILLDEPESRVFDEAMQQDGEVLVSAATVVELLIVAGGRGQSIYEGAVRFLGRPYVRIVSVDEVQVWAAARAHQTYGRGRHPAALNFGDTFSYALAATRGLSLLFKGNDFNLTDIPSAASS